MIRSLFLSMQALGKGARRPEGIAPAPTKKLGILGAGLMGAGIAHVSAMAGIDCVLLDRDQAAADKGKAYSANIFDKLIGRGRSSEDKKGEVLARIHPTASYDDLKGCDLIIEAVFEDRGIKADVTKMAEAQIAPDVIFGSNTSTLPITGLAEASERPENFIGIHFFSPVERMGLVEIIMGEKTSDAALAKTIDYVQQIRKTPIVVNDSRGFYTSRVVSTFTGEGLRMLAEGISPALIENSGRMSGMPMGPLELSDSVGSDTALKISRAAVKELGDDAIAPEVMKAMEWIVEGSDRVGRKAGKGFYDYNEKGKRSRLWPEVFAYADKAAGGKAKGIDDYDVEDLKKRFLYIQAIETARCWEEGVITDVRDADVGSILGFGYAPYTGGTLSYIDMVGIKEFVAEAERLAKTYGPRFEPPKLLKDMAAKGESFYQKFAPPMAA
jgi:3-hydroxyacyl-CoA dehydrogenase/enoyl-CoA hydratase/3-hydroxybutyryl-CoA epimerase